MRKYSVSLLERRHGAEDKVCLWSTYTIALIKKAFAEDKVSLQGVSVCGLPMKRRDLLSDTGEAGRNRVDLDLFNNGHVKQIVSSK